MSEQKRKYDSTVARIAGNVIGHLIYREELGNGPNLTGYSYCHKPSGDDIITAVAIARAIVAETIRTEPEGEGRYE